MEKEKVMMAPELRVSQWIDADGNETTPIRLEQFKGKFKIIYCFQHWCPGCHSVGFPALQKLIKAFEGADQIAFMVVQTVFEGEESNTYDKLRETQLKYDLKVPFGHDSTPNGSTVMEDYRSGGTPWFILIDEQDRLVFADFQINVDGAIAFLKDRFDVTA